MMIYSCVEVREMKRQCRTLRISAEHNTSVRITDVCSLLTWIPHSAMQLLDRMRTGRRRRQSMAQFGEEELISFVKCIIQGITLPRVELCEAKVGQNRH